MLDPKRFFPKNVWERTPDGWVSRPAVKADHVRRELYLIGFAERQEARNEQ
jgi:hypothetical protein